MILLLTILSLAIRLDWLPPPWEWFDKAEAAEMLEEAAAEHGGVEEGIRRRLRQRVREQQHGVED